MSAKPSRVLLACLAAGLLAASATPAAETITRQAPLAPGGELVVEVESASVSVSGDPGASNATLEISGERGWQERYEMSVETGPSRVTLLLDRGRGSGGGFWDWLFGGGGQGITVTVTVPERTRVIVDTSGGDISVRDLADDASLDTSGGDVTARGVRGTVLADTSGGDIVIEDLEGSAEADTSGGDIILRRISGSAEADTSGGDIEAYRVGGKLDADTSGGSITVEEVTGRVSASTSGGSILARFGAGPFAGGELSTSGGDVTVHLDGSHGAELVADASGGRVTCEVPIEAHGQQDRDYLRGRIRGGGPRLELSTSAGSIQILPRQ